MITYKVFESELDWLDFRRGRFTASRINDLLGMVKRPMTDAEYTARPKGSTAKTIEDESLLSQGAITYICEVFSSEFAEPKPQILNFSMEWGKEHEAHAVFLASQLIGDSITDSDFIYTSSNGFVFFDYNGIAGGTPDVITKSANYEIKCPDSHTHAYYRNFITSETIKKKLPEYYAQIQFNLFLTQRLLCYFVSYDPRYKNEKQQLHIVEVKEDKNFQAFIIRKIHLAHAFKLTLK